MLVSVVTIALNAARDLPLTIESVAAQDFDDFEYIVVDGQSWDSSYDVFKRYTKDIDRLLQTEDSGVYSAMNFAVTHCRGKYILFMNAGDTFYSSQALSNVFLHVGDADPDIIHGDHIYVDKSVELHKQSTDFALTRSALLNGEISSRWLDRVPCHQATLTKRELFARFGGYDTRLEICADHDFLLRAFDGGATTKYVDETIAHYFGGGFSAQRGERCRLEWIRTYRSRSRFPRTVDNFFGSRDLVLYDSQSQTTGAKLSGFYCLEDSSPETDLDTTYCWCAGEGFAMISPPIVHTIGVVLVGKNQLKGQTLSFTHQGQTLCEIEVPLGWYEVEASFPYPVAPQSIVDIFPARASHLPDDTRFVSVMLKSFHFQSLNDLNGKALTLGRTYILGRCDVETSESLLRSGWSAPEATHVWSVGKQSHLILPPTEAAQELTIVLGGNPWVPDEAREVTIQINGVTVQDKLHLSETLSACTLSLAGSAWSSASSNFVTFVSGQTATAPNDPRDLGICLHSIMLT